MALLEPIALVLSLTLAVPAYPLYRADAMAAPDASGMSDEEKIERAKALFAEGENAFQAGNFPTALEKFEEAYNVYAPGIHVFNVNIGMAAFEAGDCAKAKVSLQRFLDLVPDHPARSQAQEKLLEIERSGCAQVQAEPSPTPAGEADLPPPPPSTDTTSPVYDDDDSPILTSRSSEREEQIESERAAMNRNRRPMLVAGAVLTGLGAALVVGGGVSYALAKNKAAELEDLSGEGPLGFPEGNYANDDVYSLDQTELPNNNLATYILFAGGGALLITGVALVAVDLTRRKKAGGGGKRADLTRPHLVGLAPALLPQGGGAGATFRF